jgi:dethiobiotin synthetase
VKLVVVTGVGTGIGKTHLTAALAMAWGRSAPVLAYKPIESGVTGDVGEDEAALAAVSTFHVKPSPLQLRFRAPLAPPVAAHFESREIILADVVREVRRLHALTDLLVELPGGLFSPVSDTDLNADLVRRLAPDAVLLIAPDRLGVLHDVLAVVEACERRALALTGIVLMAPEVVDASTGLNVDDLRGFTDVPVFASLPRASISQLATIQPVVDLARRLGTPTRGGGRPTNGPGGA